MGYLETITKSFREVKMNKKKLKKAEWKILIYVVVLLVIGLVALYSATIGSELVEFKKQLMWIGLGIAILASMIFIDYKMLAKFSIAFYVISIILLGVVLLTSRINGATSWFNLGGFSLQPGEFAKVAVVLFLAYAFEKLRSQ